MYQDIKLLAIEFEKTNCHNCRDKELCLNMNDCKTYMDYLSEKLGRIQYNQH